MEYDICLLSVFEHSRDVAYVSNEARSSYTILKLTGCLPIILEGSAATIWENIDGVQTVSEIADKIVPQDAPRGPVELSEFISSLHKESYICSI